MTRQQKITLGEMRASAATPPAIVMNSRRFIASPEPMAS
jgi:hypothetical protein